MTSLTFSFRRPPRRWVHLGFALVSLTLLATTGWQALRWQQARAVNLRLADAALAEAPPAGAEERLAWALGAARRGGFDAAVKVLKELAQQHTGTLRRTALYDLGTLYLEQAQRQQGPQGTATPLVELAKQPLRDLLREDPQDWPARYQLERALRLSPEVDETARDDPTPDVQKERTMSTGPAIRIELP